MRTQSGKAAIHFYVRSTEQLATTGADALL
jgi:hypothetical protein